MVVVRSSVLMPQRAKKYSYMLMKIISYPLFFASFLYSFLLAFNAVLYTHLNTATVKFFNLDISFGNLGSYMSIYECIYDFIISFLLFSSSYFLFCLMFRRDLLKGRVMQYIALFFAGLNLLLAFYVVGIAFNNIFHIGNVFYKTGNSWAEYLYWFSSKNSKIILQASYTFFTSLLISYICFCVYSEKLFISMFNIAKEKYLEINHVIFCSFFCFPPLFIFSIKCLMKWEYYCELKQYLYVISHGTGIYGFVSNSVFDYLLTYCETHH